MKKIILFFGALWLAFFSFAQNSTYKELIQKADLYYQNQNWIYALGYYADAILADPAYSEEAATKFNTLSATICNGNPGAITYSEEELYSNWKKLLMETEKYWSEFCPYNITLSPVELKSENKDFANFWADINIQYSEKYNFIMDAVEQGYRTAYDFSWDLPVPINEYSSDGYRYSTPDDYWPRVSVTKGNALKNGNTFELTTNPEDFYNLQVATIGFSSTAKNDYEKVFEKGKNLKIYTDKAIGEFYNSFAYHEPMDAYCNTLYEIKIKFVANDGSQIIDDNSYILFHNFDSNETGLKVEIINIPITEKENFIAKEYVPVIEELNLHLGFQSSQMYNTDQEQNFFFTENQILSLPKLSYNINNCATVFYSGKRQKDRFAAFLFANLFREDLLKGIKKGKKKIQTPYGTTQYLLGFKFQDDFIEFTPKNKTASQSYRIPLWVLSKICNRDCGTPDAYDNFGNLIDDKGYIVGLDYSNQYFTFKKFEGLSEEKRNALWASALKKADRQFKKRSAAFELADYYYFSGEVEFYDYVSIRLLYRQLDDAIAQYDTEQILKICSTIEKQFPLSKYKIAENKCKKIHSDAKIADSLFLDLAKKYNEYVQFLLNDSLCKDQLIEIKTILLEYKKSKKSIFEKYQYLDKLKSISFDSIETRIDYLTNTILKYNQIYNECLNKMSLIINKLENIPSEEFETDEQFVFAQNSLDYYNEILNSKNFDEFSQACDNLNKINLEELEENVDTKLLLANPNYFDNEYFNQHSLELLYNVHFNAF